MIARLRAALVIAVCFCGTARAEETEVSFAYVPAPEVEQIVVEQPLGRLTVRGWDRPEVRIAATKRAPDHGGLDRLRVRVDLKDGRVEIVTGVRVGDVLRSVPTESGYAIDLAVDAPSGVQVRASTFDGDLDAVGLRRGAELRSSGGAIHATDIDGPVRSTATRGRQRLAAIRGDVEAEGLRGELELDSIEGALLRASVVEGAVTARRIRARAVEIVVARGDIELLGAMPLGGRWSLRAPAGKGRVVVERAVMSLMLEAGGGLKAPSLVLRGQAQPSRSLRLDRPGSARLIDARVGGTLELVEAGP
jgi:hypothetical protein